MPHFTTTTFDPPGNPLIVVIEQDANGDWQIQPSATDVSVKAGSLNGKKHKDICDKRGGVMKNPVKPEWNKRRAAGAPANPLYFSGDHVPIVLIPGEVVQFKCNFPFTIWMGRDPNVSAVPPVPPVPPAPGTPSPENPLGVTLPVTVTGAGPVYTAGPFTVQSSQQIFYKCVAYVDIGGGQTVVIDPDSIIDF